MGQLAAALDVQPDLIRRAMNSPGPAQNGSRNGQGTHSEAPQKAPERTPSGPPPPPAELKIIAILADHPGLLPEAEQLGVRSLLTDERLRDMYSAAQAGRPLHEAIPREISGVVLREVLAGSYKSLAEPSRTLADALRSLSRDRLLAEFEALGKQLKDAQRRGDQTLARELALRQVETRTKADRMMRRPEEDPR